MKDLEEVRAEMEHLIAIEAPYAAILKVSQELDLLIDAVMIKEGALVCQS